MLGEALQEKRLKDHVAMSEKKAEVILSKYALDTATRNNILACVREHHGTNKFFSRESEVVCNADCYRFISVSGFLGAARFVRDMDFEDWIDLMRVKAEEKCNALSLDICKKELEPQYKIIKSLLEEYKKHAL